MMKKAFVDTGAWFAFFVASDPDHRVVCQAFEQWEGRLLTTEYVFDELVTLLLYRTGHNNSVRAGNALRSGAIAEMVMVQFPDIEHAWRQLCLEADKRYSFTDCTSFAVMKRLGVDTAVAVDKHFRQAGFVVLPSG
jgi:predicted nucleic acid-binding protein